MKIVFISETSIGGVEKVNTTLANGLVHLGYDVEMISLLKKNYIQTGFDFKIKFLNKKSRKSAFKELILELINIQPKIIICCNVVDIYILELYKKRYNISAKIIYVQHSVYSSSLNSIKGKIKNKFIPCLLKVFNKLDGIIFVSNGVKKDFYKIFPNCQATNEVIYNPITDDKNKFNYHLIDRNNIKLVSAGRIEKEKNQIILIDAAKLLKNRGYNISLDIFGVGTLKNELNQYIVQNKTDYVKLKGFSNNLSSELKKYDIFILSSNYESFGNVLVEAMNNCLIVVSTDCPYGPNEILENGKYGYLCKINDAKKIADNVEMAINNSSIEKIKESYDRSLKFGIEESINNYISFFNKL